MSIIHPIFKTKTSQQANEESLLRGRVYINLDINRKKLMDYLGYSDFRTMYNQFTEEDKRKCEVLAGSNGRTIYKIIQIRRTNNT